MDKFWGKTLTRKLIRLLLIGFGIAVIVFFVLLKIANTFLSEYFFSSDYIYESETAYIEELEDFVAKENLAATDTERLGEWAHKKGIHQFTISRDRILIYDSTYSDSIILSDAESESLHYNWQYFHSVEFADGHADVFIYADYEMKFYVLSYIAIAFLSVLIWILIFALGIRKEVKYIQQLSTGVEKIGAGALDYVVPIKGTDELGDLARGLNQMRLALVEKQENERKMKAAQEKLVLGMAHDLRTPLTGLMTFLEIAKKQQDLKECNEYINKAYSKTLQIRDLSNQLFDFFLINSESPMKLETPETVEYALGEYLSELYGLLEMEHFLVSVEELYWEPVEVQISTDYVGRIIDNLVSNIKKYADPSMPVVLSSKYTESYVSITIRNTPAEPDRFVHGTGIGIKNVHMMMAQMRGLANVNIESASYAITLSFPIVSRLL